MGPPEQYWSRVTFAKAAYFKYLRVGNEQTSDSINNVYRSLDTHINKPSAVGLGEASAEASAVDFEDRTVYKALKQATSSSCFEVRNVCTWCSM